MDEPLWLLHVDSYSESHACAALALCGGRRDSPVLCSLQKKFIAFVFCYFQPVTKRRKKAPLTTVSTACLSRRPFIKFSEPLWKCHLLPFFLPDYRTLRIGGLVFAVVFFTVGILLILSKAASRVRIRAATAQLLGACRAVCRSMKAAPSWSPLSLEGHQLQWLPAAGGGLWVAQQKQWLKQKQPWAERLPSFGGSPWAQLSVGHSWCFLFSPTPGRRCRCSFNQKPRYVLMPE